MANKEALRALQERLAQRLQTVRAQAPSRSWLAVELAGHGFLMPLDQAGEIFPLSGVLPVPHSQPWFLGVANLRGQLHGVVDLAAFMGLSQRTVRLGGEGGAREAGRLVAFGAALQMNTALVVDRLMGLRNPQDLRIQPEAADAGRPAFVSQCLIDEQGRIWYELDLAALVADEAFLSIEV